mgnify:FL=1
MTRFDIAQLLSLIRFNVCNPISDLEIMNGLHQYQKLFTSLHQDGVFSTKTKKTNNETI